MNEFFDDQFIITILPVIVEEVNPFFPVDTIKRDKSVLTHFLSVTL